MLAGGVHTWHPIIGRPDRYMKSWKRVSPPPNGPAQTEEEEEEVIGWNVPGG